LAPGRFSQDHGLGAALPGEVESGAYEGFSELAVVIRPPRLHHDNVRADVDGGNMLRYVYDINIGRT
jgi:hypothetical protein